MGLFKSKEEKKRERLMKEKKAMRDLEKRIAQLKQSEEGFKKQIKEADENNLPQAKQRAFEGLKEAMIERKRTHLMLINARIYSLRRENAESQKTFLDSVQVITTSLSETAKGTDARKVAQALGAAMAKAAENAENIDQMMQDSMQDSDAFGNDEYNVSDEEIEKAAYGASGSSSSSTSDSSIDSELAALGDLLK